jgi:hypothetical protein
MTKKNKLQTTVEELLRTEEIPQPVQDWLRRYAGELTLPYADRIDYYHPDVEIFVAALADPIVANDPLPKAARDYVEEFLYRLEEAYGVHIWDTPELARIFLGIVLCINSCSEPLGDGIGTMSAKTALSRLCTRRELMEFHERHGLEDNDIDRSKMAGSAPLEWSDRQCALKAARILADPRTDEDVSQRLREEITELANSTQVGVAHPALVERALTLMFEARRKGYAKEIKRNRAALFKLLDELPDIGEDEKGADQ